MGIVLIVRYGYCINSEIWQRGGVKRGGSRNLTTQEVLVSETGSSGGREGGCFMRLVDG